VRVRVDKAGQQRGVAKIDGLRARWDGGAATYASNLAA
jgi:hypothetical protein